MEWGEKRGITLEILRFHARDLLVDKSCVDCHQTETERLGRRKFHRGSRWNPSSAEPLVLAFQIVNVIYNGEHSYERKRRWGYEMFIPSISPSGITGLFNGSKVLPYLPSACVNAQHFTVRLYWLFLMVAKFSRTYPRHQPKLGLRTNSR